MSTTIATAARRVLAGALAAAALTTGVGLAGSGIAEAAPPHRIYTCISNVHGTTTVTDHGKSATYGLYPLSDRDSHCSAVGSNAPEFNVGMSVVGFNGGTVPGWSTEGDGNVSVSDFDPATGAVKVKLFGRVLVGPKNPRTQTVGGVNSVELTLRPGKGYEMDETTIDIGGRKVHTQMFFDLDSPIFN